MNSIGRGSPNWPRSRWGADRSAGLRHSETRGSMGMGLVSRVGKKAETTRRAGRGRGGAVMAAFLAALCLAPTARAEQPYDWQMAMQAAASPVRDRIDSLHNELLVIITLISIFVLGLLLYVVVRFNAKSHPTPSHTTHNTLLEVMWTVVPVLILIIIAIPSFKLLYYNDKTQHADMTLKVTGHQWYWTYDYPDQAGLSFDSSMMPEADARKA